MGLKRVGGTSFRILLITFSLIGLLSIEVSASNESGYTYVDLEYLARHMEDYYGMKVKTEGIVKFYVSFYMYEDFWLAVENNEYVAIPVVVRDTGLLTPPGNTSIQVFGTVEYSSLEGGFYYLRAQELEVIPEFPSFLILSLFMIATLLAVVVYRKRQNMK